MENLRSAWGSIPADHKQVIGPQGCPDEFKQIAQAADAKSAPEDSAGAGVDPDTGEVLQPMQSDTPTAPKPLGDAAESPNSAAGCELMQLPFARIAVGRRPFLSAGIGINPITWTPDPLETQKTQRGGAEVFRMLPKQGKTTNTE